MMITRPCIATDAPPTSIEVGGLVYEINTDYRVWVEVINDLRGIRSVNTSEEDALMNLAKIIGISARLCGGKLIRLDSMEQIGEFLGAVAQFAQGYPQAPTEPDTHGSGKPVYSFNYDLGSIVCAFKHYYGEDISWRCESYHWWEFMEKFRALCGQDLMILRLMEIRGYEGKDEELRRLAMRMALPNEYTADEEAMLKGINDEFYGAV